MANNYQQQAQAPAQNQRPYQDDNECMFSGRLYADARVVDGKNGGKPFVGFDMAHATGQVDQAGNPDTIPLVCTMNAYDANREAARLKKGTKVIVWGRSYPRIHEYNGKQTLQMRVFVTRVRYIETSKAQSAPTQAAPAPAQQAYAPTPNQAPVPAQQAYAPAPNQAAAPAYTQQPFAQAPAPVQNQAPAYAQPPVQQQGFMPAPQAAAPFQAPPQQAAPQAQYTYTETDPFGADGEMPSFQMS